MIKRVIKAMLGKRNTARIRAALTAWRHSLFTASEHQNKTVSVLMSVHMLEKALVMGREKYLNAIKYHDLISNIAGLIESGTPPEAFEIAGSVAIIAHTLNTLSGHDAEKSELESLIAKYNIPQNFKGGIERIPSSEIFSHNDFDFHAFVSSRHSVRRFKDKIVSREIIRSIIREAEFYPSACNRQPCRVYYSENPETIARITKNIDGFVAPEVHDCMIVTCDRALLLPAERNDQEYVNGGIFLGYLVMSVHAHGLGSCLFQFLQVNSRQESIKREFGISPSEVIVAFLGIGEPEDEVICACAQRRPIDEVAIILDE